LSPPKYATSSKKRIQQSPGEGAVQAAALSPPLWYQCFLFHSLIQGIFIVHCMLFFTLAQTGISEPDKFVTEFSQIFLHRKAAFLKNAISLFDYFIDQIPRRKKEIDGNFGLL
jgi:hypothetical protein